MHVCKLVCIAHAGGSAASYLHWKKHLTSDIRMVPLEYAGRGTRAGEPLLEAMDETVNDLVQMLKPELNQQPYALLGHSLGAVVAYELACTLQQLGYQEPELLIVSGKNPPHMQASTHRHTLPESLFREELIRLGGTPSELLADEDFIQYFMPIARSDFKLVETYKIQHNRPKLRTNLYVINGMDDIFVKLDNMSEWGDYCEGTAIQHLFAGGHFYLHEQPEQVTNYLNRLISNQIFM